MALNEFTLERARRHPSLVRSEADVLVGYGREVISGGHSGRQ
jgi:hypothetical protein